jgi:hypothetical protein
MAHGWSAITLHCTRGVLHGLRICGVCAVHWGDFHEPLRYDGLPGVYRKRKTQYIEARTVSNCCKIATTELGVRDQEGCSYATRLRLGDE